MRVCCIGKFNISVFTWKMPFFSKIKERGKKKRPLSLLTLMQPSPNHTDSRKHPHGGRMCLWLHVCVGSTSLCNSFCVATEFQSCQGCVYHTSGDFVIFYCLLLVDSVAVVHLRFCCNFSHQHLRDLSSAQLLRPVWFCSILSKVDSQSVTSPSECLQGKRSGQKWMQARPGQTRGFRQNC